MARAIPLVAKALTNLLDYIQQLNAGHRLDRNQARDAFERIMAGQVDSSTLGAFVCALKAGGESVEELAGAAQAMRAAATRVRCSKPCMDTCGTGGDGVSTFNVSTTAALIAAAAGAIVAKHGNRTSSRVSGSAEVLEALGVSIRAPVSTLERCLEKLGIAFLYAPDLHPAMKHAAPVRKAVRVRTIFNLLGPLANPAGATRQLLGVSRERHLDLMAKALLELGAERAWVVHGADGLCDLTITGPTQVREVANGHVRRFTIQPEDAGLRRSPLAALMVGSPAESAAAVRDVLHDAAGPRTDHALLNAGAALVVYGIAGDLREGVALAARAVDTGKARELLEALARESRG